MYFHTCQIRVFCNFYALKAKQTTLDIFHCPLYVFAYRSENHNVYGIGAFPFLCFYHMLNNFRHLSKSCYIFLHIHAKTLKIMELELLQALIGLPSKH